MENVTGGSPPRVREKQIDLQQFSEIQRITPACAGKTGSESTSWVVGWDHPRVCGKNQNIVVELKLEVGSPPRVREKRHGFIEFLTCHRITPACAGKTERPYPQFHFQ